MKSIFAVALAGAVFSMVAAPLASAQIAPPELQHLSGPVESPQLSDLPHAHWATTPHEVNKHFPPAPGPGPNQSSDTGTVQTSPGPQIEATPGMNASGIGYNGSWPPDPNIAVGPNHIVEVVNTEIAVFDKTGKMYSGYPVTLSSLWSPVAGCGTDNGGDPVVQYDRLADRWLITQLGSLSAPYSECFAISQTNDPTKGYNLYTQNFGNYLNDYPKFGVWPTKSNSAYLGSYNLFWLGNSFKGAELCAYDRAAMLSGASSPAALCYNVGAASFLPADLDGSAPPLDGTPGYFLDFNTTSSLRLYKLSPNFAPPASGTLTQATPDIAVASFREACGGGSCVPQPNTGQSLDSLGDRLMNRLAYRVVSNTQISIVVNHSVALGRKGAGVRWYELRPGSGTFSVFQSGTYAPDSAYRWMGSMAMDKVGDIALGYSKSSSSVPPSIAYTGRVPTDTAGTMESETVMLAGTGSQTGTNRWGDYTAMRIDPSDDCTFWYVNEYYPFGSAQVQWSTAFGSFKFPGCN